jgi:hypothetical protein
MQHIWHIKVRRLGRADHEIADIRLDQPRAPIQGETFDAAVTREKVRVKIGFFNTSTSGSTATHKILADEIDNGNLPGYREATAEDFR